MSQQINMLLHETRQTRGGFARVLLWLVAIAGLSTAAVGAYEQYRVSELRKEAAAARNQLATAQAEHDRGKTAERARAAQHGRDADLEKLLVQLKRRQEVIDTLKGGILGTPDGFSEFMRAFSRQTVDGVWLTAFEIDAGGQDLTLSGRAMDADLVPRYLERLTTEPLFKGRQFSSLRIEQPPAHSTAAPGEATKGAKPERTSLRFVEFSVSTAASRSVGPEGKSSSAPAAAPEAASAPSRDKAKPEGASVPAKSAAPGGEAK